jgi:D-lactate dehydrogenase
MRIAVFSTKAYDSRFLAAANVGQAHDLMFYDVRLTAETARLAAGAEAVCAFVNDEINAPVLHALSKLGVRLLVLRCAGFNNVDLAAARDLGIAVARVPAYSPHAVAEHTIALILTLNRKTHRSFNRVREGNFALEGLLGFDLAGKTAGIIGTGKIGVITGRILAGFGCTVLGGDPFQKAEFQAFGRYVPLGELFAAADIISLHCPLTPETHHLINQETIAAMKRGVMLINTSRGAIVDTRALIPALKSNHIGYLGLDVYEEEADLFFEDLSQTTLADDVFARLLTFPNVLITGHQAFFTREALTNIAETTIANVTAYEQTGLPKHPISTELLA